MINSVQFSNHNGQSVYTLVLHTMSNFQLACNCLVYVYIIYCMWENFDVEKTENLMNRMPFTNVLLTSYLHLYSVVAIQAVHLSIFYPPIGLD